MLLLLSSLYISLCTSLDINLYSVFILYDYHDEAIEELVEEYLIMENGNAFNTIERQM